MIRNLLIASGIALAVSVICLSAAGVFFGRAIQNGHDWNWTFNGNSFSYNYDKNRLNVSTSGEGGATSLGPADRQVITRNEAWGGATQLHLTFPAEVTYVQGDANTAVITGPKHVVDHIRIRDGHLEFDSNAAKQYGFKMSWNNGNLNLDEADIKITVTAPSVNRFNISGAGDVDIIGYDQPELHLAVSGMGDIEASGRADALKLDISGAGEADLEKLVLKDAEINVSGKGDATIAATGAVKVNVSGVGDVKLKTKPASLTQNISGMGKVRQE